MQTISETPAGSVPGGILLVSGCCIGAGMLGLPVLSALAGFEPSLLMFVLSWLFMACTGLLLLEVNLWFKDEVSIISMADRTLGTYGKAIGWIGFLFLFYAIMVAYISGSGELFADFVRDITRFELAPWLGSLILTLLFTVFLYLGTKAVDHFNRVLMAGLVLSYVLMVSLGLPHINLTYLKHHDWNAIFLVVPTMIISFGYHNLIPSLTTYLKGDAKRLRLVILAGSAIPLLIYLLWEALILGLIPVEGEGGFRQGFTEGNMATQLLKGVVGASWVVDLAQYFAFFAIVTSFLGVGLSFVDFLADGLHIKKNRRGKLLLCLLVIAPPFLFAMVYPRIFLMALNYAGAYGAVVLFGILPAAMVWSGRYIKKLEGVRQVPGGKWTLLAVMFFAFGVIFVQLWDTLKLSQLNA